jgi:ectoine hydroxylase-related dioxygenase (phytanoyl-CoA dioxygenase family)
LTATTTRLPVATTDAAQIRADLDEHGLAIVKDMLTADEVASIRARLVEQAAGEYAAGVAESDAGPVTEPGPIQYVWSLISKGQEFRDLLVRSDALSYVRHVLGPDVITFSYTGNAIGPGAPGGGAHTDQIYMPADTPWPIVCNVIYMLDDFTADNGATLVVPGSHRRPIGELTHEEFVRHAVPAVGRAGSALVMESRVWHSIGINRTADVVRHGILAAYCKPFIRPQENWTLSVPREIVDAAPPILRELMGYKSWQSLGGVGGPYGQTLEQVQGWRDDAASSTNHLQIAAIDWGWASPAPTIIGELDANGAPR